MTSKRRPRANAADLMWKNKKRRSLRKESRNWLDLPRDVMLLIFMKLGVVEILVNAKNVCSSWWKLAKEPLLFREIDFRGAKNYIKSMSQFDMFSKEAVDRSCGQLVKFSCPKNFYVARILLDGNCTNSIKSLQLEKGTAMAEVDLAAICKRLYSLEELDIWWFYFPRMVIEEIGRTCRKLTSIRLGKLETLHSSFDEEATSIVRSMPQLRRLGLVGYLLTNNGLRTILDGCPQLEHLDLQHCSCDQVEKNLLKTCAMRIRNVIPPDGSTFRFKLVNKLGQTKFNDDTINTAIELCMEDDAD